MESHLLKQIQEEFQTSDLYQVLGLQKGTDITSINQAYRKLALKYHPDRVNGNAKKFQALSAVHSILSDENKRKEYDETGNLDNEDYAADFDSWYEYYRRLFPAITVSDIETYLSKYRNSTEESTDVIELYKRFNGDLSKIIEFVIGSDDENAIQRICSIIDQAIQTKQISLTKIYEKTKSKLLKIASSLSSSSSKAASKRKPKMTDITNLEERIMLNKKNRSMSNLFSKYDDVEDEPEISDSEFDRIQQSLLKKKSKSKK
jgi:DnaJ family protein C protein 9